MTLYDLLRPALFCLDSEDIHHLALDLLADPEIVDVLDWLCGRRVPHRPTIVAGLHFRNPIGLAAGFDKNAVALPAWRALGFGFVEVGTVTPRPQAGNPRPRMHRFPDSEALVNSLGFPNDGASIVCERVAEYRDRSGMPVGINLGKGVNTPLEHAAEDYLACLKFAAPAADYLVVNVSSPNTPGLRQLQSKNELAALLAPVADANRNSSERRPLFLKVAPDLSERELADIVETAAECRLQGIIATNTTRDHSSLRLAHPLPGGLSGRPLRSRSTETVRILSRLTQGRLAIIACGGILDPEDFREKQDAGATLVQLYTGLVYRGPSLVRHLLRD